VHRGGGPEPAEEAFPGLVSAAARGAGCGTSRVPGKRVSNVVTCTGMGRAGAGGLDFEHWYRREHPRALVAITVAAGSLEVAQDVAAEAFSRALERWDRVSAMESPTGWVYRVAFNVLRRRQRRSSLEARLLARTLTPAVAPSETIDPDVWRAIAALPPRQRAVIGLRVVLDLSQADTARMLDISEGAVSSTLVAARRKVAQQLREPRIETSSAVEAKHE
jgi:RNA polymerase sigma factor (sigma-70 family)